MSKKVELKPILKLFTIFTSKKWTDIDGYEEILERFGELINNLKEEEIVLILELVERYIYYSYNEYHKQLRISLKTLQAKYLDGITKVYLFPIIKPSDEEKIKSGHAVMYMIDSIKSSINEYQSIDFIKLNKFEDISSEKLNLEDNELLLLVDDYIGTGVTLNKTLKQLKKNESIKDKFAIISVMIQEEARIFLETNNVKLIFGEQTNKGISNFYQDQELQRKRKIMNDIERLIPGLNNYSFGFETSEALVTMIKTPNNTFPVFWKDYTVNGTNFKAPFPRY